ncbi:hypothetical protein [Azospira oryzae]|uniref:Uncharacterized protein n=1 Tax=Azospira oryzae (strain ATCC BAA-33 / DSM 13638 / PS) TaxID=640081 RepID=G8QP49_AZOOP|nr:hypothetical protein [Azospira oryzae]AEV25902.1 hypothetical protein Dsui_1513 [Azospira oryzae PS]
MSLWTELPVLWKTVLLLSASNVFMTFEGYTMGNTCRVSQFPLFAG